MGGFEGVKIQTSPLNELKGGCHLLLVFEVKYVQGCKNALKHGLTFSAEHPALVSAEYTMPIPFKHFFEIKTIYYRILN